MYRVGTYLALNQWSLVMDQVSMMVTFCPRCDEPIRGFRGYDPEEGEVCFTCYLEMLRKPSKNERKELLIVT